METVLIENIYKKIIELSDERIILLKNKEVIDWIFGDLSFLPKIDGKSKTKSFNELKKLEDIWGQTILKQKRPDLKLDGQWTNKFGEHLCEELFILQNNPIIKPIKKLNYQPDFETETNIIEVKAQTYYTSGTAGEKILGVPFKYAQIPTLYSKPLKILCIGNAEKISRENYGNLPGEKCCPEKKLFIDFFKSQQIEYIAATDILRNLFPIKSKIKLPILIKKSSIEPPIEPLIEPLIETSIEP